MDIQPVSDCSNCGSCTDEPVFVCDACPRAAIADILPRLVPTPGATSWSDPLAMQWRDPTTARDYYALDADGDLIVAGGLQDCTVALVEVQK